METVYTGKEQYVTFHDSDFNTKLEGPCLITLLQRDIKDKTVEYIGSLHGRHLFTYIFDLLDGPYFILRDYPLKEKK